MYLILFLLKSSHLKKNIGESNSKTIGGVIICLIINILCISLFILFDQKRKEFPSESLFSHKK